MVQSDRVCGFSACATRGLCETRWKRVYRDLNVLLYFHILIAGLDKSHVALISVECKAKNPIEPQLNVSRTQLVP